MNDDDGDAVSAVCLIDEYEILNDLIRFVWRCNPACQLCHTPSRRVSEGLPSNVPNTRLHCPKCTIACRSVSTSLGSRIVPEKLFKKKN
jgi:hypothetical protein